MVFNDYSEDFIAHVRREASVCLLAAAFLIQTDLKQSLSTSYPPASIPGEYPHGRTWTGRDNVAIIPDTPEEIARVGFVRIGFFENAWYMVHLELNRQRLGLFHTFEKLKPAIQELLSRK